MRSSEWRRFQENRIKKARSNYWGGIKGNKRKLGIVLNTPKDCSCWACGNPRRHLKGDDLVTYQELKFLAIEANNYQELLLNHSGTTPLRIK